MNLDPIPILAVDDDPKVCFVLEQGLNGEQYRVFTANDGETALEILPDVRPLVVLLDLKMPGLDGFEVLGRIKRDYPGTAVLVLSGHTETANVVLAMRQGADDFISKPFDIDIVRHSLRRVLEKQNLEAQVTRLRQELEKDSAQDMLVGESPLICKTREQIELVAPTDLTVLIRGESGTGKDVCARLIHRLSTRAQQPFIKVNCAALPENLLESELFGHEKGAFTGAQRTKPGRFELARNGAVFLDEIGELPIALQPKLLQAIEHKEFVRVGGTKTIEVDVRFIAATNQDIERQIVDRSFREDLFFRLNEFMIYVHPLRDRREDIPLLVEHFLHKYSRKYKRTIHALSPTSRQLLLDYHWPGNVRELESLIKRVLVLDSESIIENTIRPALLRGQTSVAVTGASRRDAPPEPSAASESDGTGSAPLGIKPLKATVREVIDRTEKLAIREALEKTKWNRKKAARLLKISYSSLLRRIEKYNLEES